MGTTGIGRKKNNIWSVEVNEPTSKLDAKLWIQNILQKFNHQVFWYIKREYDSQQKGKLILPEKRNNRNLNMDMKNESDSSKDKQGKVSCPAPDTKPKASYTKKRSLDRTKDNNAKGGNVSSTAQDAQKRRKQSPGRNEDIKKTSPSTTLKQGKLSSLARGTKKRKETSSDTTKGEQSSQKQKKKQSSMTSFKDFEKYSALDRNLSLGQSVTIGKNYLGGTMDGLKGMVVGKVQNSDKYKVQLEEEHANILNCIVPRNCLKKIL